MKQGPQREDADGLGVVLQRWRLEGTLPPRFEEGVWRRIAAAQNQPGTTLRVWQALLQRWEALIRKPVGVAACLTLFTALGVGFGYWHAQVYTAQAANAWQQAYMSSVNPTNPHP